MRVRVAPAAWRRARGQVQGAASEISCIGDRAEPKEVGDRALHCIALHRRSTTETSFGSARRAPWAHRTASSGRATSCRPSSSRRRRGSSSRIRRRSPSSRVSSARPRRAREAAVACSARLLIFRHGHFILAPSARPSSLCRMTQAPTSKHKCTLRLYSGSNPGLACACSLRCW